MRVSLRVVERLKILEIKKYQKNLILLLLKSHVCNARKYGFLPLNKFFNEFCKIKNLEKRAVVNNRNKCERFRK